MIPAPPGYDVKLEHACEAGGTWSGRVSVAAFSEDGIPLVVDPGGYYGTGLVSPREIPGVIRWSLQERPRSFVTGAEAGWYALTEVTFADGEQIHERLPVIAWRTDDTGYGGSATVVTGDGSGRILPQDVVGYCDELSNVTLIGFFHPERLPESLLEPSENASAGAP